MTRHLHPHQEQHTASVLYDIAVERGLLAAACISAGFSGEKHWHAWQRVLPNIPSNPLGFELQCVAGLEQGLTALHPVTRERAETPAVVEAHPEEIFPQLATSPQRASYDPAVESEKAARMARLAASR